MTGYVEPGRKHCGKVANMMHLYERAKVYDIAFSYRDIVAECEFILRVCEHAGLNVSSIVDLGSGTGAHALEMAGRGMEVTAIDRMEQMLQHLLEEAGGRDYVVRTVNGDMREFAIEREVDCAISMLGTVSHLLSNEDMYAHLSCVARSLRPGGVYLLEMVHPRDVFSKGSSTESRWKVTKGDTTVTVEWGQDGDEFDAVSEIEEVSTCVTATRSGKGEVEIIEDVVKQRRYSFQCLRALVQQVDELRIIGCYGAFDLGVPLSDSAEAWRMIPVLQKSQTGS
ncbi:MAG: class I SAM-dependent methyltransferase [bacterium]|nr:class I SAM-dependent methyltransferase [bacterium]